MDKQHVASITASIRWSGDERPQCQSNKHWLDYCHFPADARLLFSRLHVGSTDLQKYTVCGLPGYSDGTHDINDGRTLECFRHLHCSQWACWWNCSIAAMFELHAVVGICDFAVVDLWHTSCSSRGTVTDADAACEVANHWTISMALDRCGSLTKSHRRSTTEMGVVVVWLTAHATKS